MANERYTRTNQKMYFAGLALDACRKAEAARQANAMALIQAEREAAIFHLYGALLGLCHEIAGYYRLPQADVAQAELLLDPQVLAAAPSPELAELIELAAQPGSWLAQLLAAYQTLFQPPREPTVAKLDPRMALIESVSLQEVEPALSLAQLEDWRQQLKGLAMRFRETLTEW
ncbi:DUF6586 family protein [Pseudomonas sp. N040]|uniref:DUF6586 family protein n=1 Tax=Pseudomonas sp. N040 TaxID=2785325 RepID=UPI0018A25F67|nr:DUF6586 family protein [Pseudomonas sp. N040]MBF7731295.1 PasA protein [Pseudomonas sp. N040]MBW7014938.1 PasA protein [Pseudomonas sp. N040]